MQKFKCPLDDVIIKEVYYIYRGSKFIEVNLVAMVMVGLHAPVCEMFQEHTTKVSIVAPYLEEASSMPSFVVTTLFVFLCVKKLMKKEYLMLS